MIAAGLVTCSETVKLNDQARSVEFISHSYAGKHGYKCTEIGDIDVSAVPTERSGERGVSVLDVKFKNEAKKMGATHVLRFPSVEWPCNKAGEDQPDSSRRCAKAAGTALSCVIGRGT